MKNTKNRKYFFLQNLTGKIVKNLNKLSIFAYFRLLSFRKDAKTISQFFMTKNGDKKNYKVLIPFTQSSWIFFMCDLQYYM